MKKSAENVDQHSKSKMQDPTASKKDKSNDNQSHGHMSKGHGAQEEDEDQRPMGHAHGAPSGQTEKAPKSDKNGK